MKKHIIILFSLALITAKIEKCHAVITWNGSSQWNISVFASPGIQGSNIGSLSAMTVSDWKAAGTSSVYASGYKINPSSGVRTDKYIYEFHWNGTSWDTEAAQITIQGGLIGAYDIIREIGFFNVRGDNSRLYFITIRGSIFEYSIDTNNYWNMDSEIKSGSAGSSIENFFIGDGRESGNLYIYAGDNNWFYEYEYTTNGWRLKSKMSTSSASSIGWITGITFGKWSNRGMRGYISYFSANIISEIELEGNTWKESSRLPINDYAANLGSPTLFVADCGRGEKLYAIQKTPGRHNNYIVECGYNRSGWSVSGIISDNYPGSVVSITCGRVSSSPNDPMCIYALVSKYYLNCPYNRANASEIHEYTYDNGKRKWVRTCIVPLYEQGALLEDNSSFVASAAQIVHLYMANARNEKETDSNGDVIDKYKRLYIIDDFGTLWECSVPIRKDRPADPEDPYNPNNPGYGSGSAGGSSWQGTRNKIIPTILGGK